MLTAVPAARSFSEFTLSHPPAAAEDTAHAPHAQWPEASDQASYFDTIMRLRCRRPLSRCRLHSRN